MKLIGKALGALSAAFLAAAPAGARELVLYDNDWSVSNGGYVGEDALAMLLGNPEIELLGLTAVSGDFWRDEGVASLLRFLELAGRAAPPVMKGAAFPLLNSAARHAAWQQRHGALPWSGAWNSRAVQPSAHPDAPFAITPPKEGLPSLRASAENAGAFLIRTVRAHPHQVTIYAEGPLTNIALAVRADPEFATLAKRIIIQGSATASDRDDGSKPAEFNFLFDPEAAHIVLGAAWPSVTLLGDIANSTILTGEILARIKAIDTPAARYAASNASVGMPLWSELGAAIIADPAIVTRTTRTIVEVDIGTGATYGRTRSWPADAKPGQRTIDLVTGIDQERFVSAYLAGLARSGRMRGSRTSAPMPPASASPAIAR